MMGKGMKMEPSQSQGQEYDYGRFQERKGAEAGAGVGRTIECVCAAKWSQHTQLMAILTLLANKKAHEKHLDISKRDQASS